MRNHSIIDVLNTIVLDRNFISENDANFINLTEHARMLYLLRLDNDYTSQVIAK